MRARFVRFVYAVAFLFVAAYAVVTLTGPKGISAVLEKRRQIRALEESNAAMAKDIERRRQRVERLGSDPEEQERVIEERFKLVHPGQTVYMLPSQPKR